MTRRDCDFERSDLLLFWVYGFLAARFAQLKFELLPLAEQGRALIAN
jgi:hypothetical protein